VDYITPFMSILLPLMWLRRRRPRLSSSAHPTTELDDEFRIVPALNAGLYRILRQERHLVARGRQLPFGTSLLVIATKEREV
jgi:hypothetical protein